MILGFLAKRYAKKGIVVGIKQLTRELVLRIIYGCIVLFFLFMADLSLQTINISSWCI